jgi:hypothetical protein
MYELSALTRRHLTDSTVLTVLYTSKEDLLLIVYYKSTIDREAGALLSICA